MSASGGEQIQGRVEIDCLADARVTDTQRRTRFGRPDPRSTWPWALRRSRMGTSCIFHTNAQQLDLTHT